MISAAFWRLFQETGDPMYYLLCREAEHEEAAQEKTA